MEFVQAFPRRHFPRKPVGVVAKCRLFCQARRRCVNEFLILLPRRVFKTLHTHIGISQGCAQINIYISKTTLDVNVYKEKNYFYSRSAGIST